MDFDQIFRVYSFPTKDNNDYILGTAAQGKRSSGSGFRPLPTFDLE